MAKFLFVYHGGSMPETDEETKRVMDAWGAWFGSMGSAVVDGGHPANYSLTLNGDGSISKDGGNLPATGYSVVEASSEEDVINKAKGCPILSNGGSIEVAEIFDM